MMKLIHILFLSSILILSSCNREDERGIDDILSKMTLQEKIGQMSQLNGENINHNQRFIQKIQDGMVGSVLNSTNPTEVNEIQRIAVEESRLGIPIIFGRDVIHGFKTIFPINVGLAASFNPELIQNSARVWAEEAYQSGVRWTFAPMVDLSRDPRWGRLAESFGEDPYLVTTMGLAVNKGFQQKQSDGLLYMATCAKHFAAYGAVEGGKDYNTVSVPLIELHNVHFRPFKALSDSGVNTFMTSFTEVNGVPASGNKFLLVDILRDSWGFNGFVVSDWGSIKEQITHGYALNTEDAAYKSLVAGVDMEMASTTYVNHIDKLIAEGKISISLIDEAVRRILQLKYNLGLFDNPYVEEISSNNKEKHLALAKEASIQSMVLLKNNDNTLPLNKDIKRLAVVGPMANDRYEQLGTWVFDGDTNLTITPLMALQSFLGTEKIAYTKALKTTRDNNLSGISKAVSVSSSADAILVVVGEESILVGEAHCRANLDLPGAQNELIKKLSETGKPIVLVIMTSRPLTIGNILPMADAVIYAWHPGTMGGPALVDILFGEVSPSGKLPVTFPKAPGQIPIYYSHKNTGRPASKDTWQPMEDIPARPIQTSLGNSNHYMDIGYEPLFPFGYGLSYTNFEYSDPELTSDKMTFDKGIDISTTITNTGDYDADEIVQLYIRDVTASITRPVKELKGFKRVHLLSGETKKVTFSINSSDLAFFNEVGEEIIEEGNFHVWIGANSDAKQKVEFELLKSK